MELWFFVGGVLTTLAVAVGSAAFRNDRKWPTFLKQIISAGTLLVIITIGIGATFSVIAFIGGHTQAALYGVTTGLAVSLGLAGIVGLALVADWLRS